MQYRDSKFLTPLLRSTGHDGMTRATAARAAFALGVHPATVCRWRQRLLEAGLLNALQGRKPGVSAGRARGYHPSRRA